MNKKDYVLIGIAIVIWIVFYGVIRLDGAAMGLFTAIILGIAGGVYAHRRIERGSKQLEVIDYDEFTRQIKSGRIGSSTGNRGEERERKPSRENPRTRKPSKPASRDSRPGRTEAKGSTGKVQRYEPLQNDDGELSGTGSQGSSTLGRYAPLGE